MTAEATEGTDPVEAVVAVTGAGAPAAETDGLLARATFALRTRSFRWWFTSQVLSASGSMTQMVAQAWLVLQLGGRAVDLGVLGVITWTPVLFAGTWAGGFVDRHDRRRLLLFTHCAAIAMCVAQAVLIGSGDMRIWMVFAFAAASGAQTAFDFPARQVYVLELVGAERVASAVGLYEVMLNASRVIGPALGGVLLATVGTAFCFIANAISYTPVLAVLLRFRPNPVERKAASGRGGLARGMAAVWREPQLRTCVLVAIAGGMLFNLSVTVPLLSTEVFHLGGGGYGAMMATFGAGAVPGAIMAASSVGAPTGSRIRLLAVLTGIAVILTAASPVAAGSFAGIAVSGFLSIWLIASANTLVQLRSDPSMVGLMMGVWSVASIGSVPVTGLVTAFVTQYIGPRSGFALAGLVMLILTAASWTAAVAPAEPATA